jgi:hypothetical protein
MSFFAQPLPTFGTAGWRTGWNAHHARSCLVKFAAKTGMLSRQKRIAKHGFIGEMVASGLSLRE